MVTIPSLHFENQPDSMSRRAQGYLSVASARHLGVGAFILFMPGQFKAAAFIPIFNALPLWLWGMLFVNAAIVLLVGAVFRSGEWARWGLIFAAAVLGACCAGVWIGLVLVWISGGTATPLVTIFMTTNVVFDLLMCTQPLRVPFETAIRRLLSPKEA